MIYNIAQEWNHNGVLEAEKIKWAEEKQREGW